MKIQFKHKEIKKHRESAGLTQRQMARKLGWTPQRISKIESGENAVNIKTFIKIAKVLKVTDFNPFFI